MEERATGIVKRWGGYFPVEYTKNWRAFLEEWKKNGGYVIHLTIYGLPIQDVISTIRGISKKILVVVGGAKVPRQVYSYADFNVAVTSQPHSEVAALAIFLHELFEGKELDKEFVNAGLKVLPSERGKRVVKC